MYRRVMAFDFDGTLAVNGNVPAEVETALEQCRASGHVLFLVTGRRFETVTLGNLESLFAGIVWENGAVLTHTASGETYLPFGQLDARLLKAIEEAGVPFERGWPLPLPGCPMTRPFGEYSVHTAAVPRSNTIKVQSWYSHQERRKGPALNGFLPCVVSRPETSRRSVMQKTISQC